MAQSYYFSYGTSFNPSAEGLDLAVTTNGTPPEKNQIFEVGAKVAFFDGALNLQSALFRIDKTNARTPNPIDPTLPNVITGKQRSQGFEIGLVGRVLPGLNIFTGYTYLNTEILKDNTAANVGKQIANVPEHSANLWATMTCWKNGRSAADRVMSAAATQTMPTPTAFRASFGGIRPSPIKSPKISNCESTESISPTNSISTASRDRKPCRQPAARLSAA